MPPTQQQPQTQPPSPLTIGTRPHLLPLLHNPSLLAALKSAQQQQPIHLHSIGHLSTMGAAEATPLHDFEDESLWTHELQTLLEEGGVDVIAVEAKDINAEKMQASLKIFKTLRYDTRHDGGALSLAVRGGDARVAGLLGPLLGVETLQE